MHKQVWVKVNAPVDAGVAELVAELSKFNGLETIESCQGGGESPAFVLFRMADWRSTGVFLFDYLMPVLPSEILDSVSLELRALGNENAIARLSVETSALYALTECIKSLLAVGTGVSVASNAHCLAVPEIV
jgi:hypothetical protein